MRSPLLASLIAGLLTPLLHAAEIAANTDLELHAAVQKAKPGDHIRLGPGPYKGGFFSTGLTGTEQQPIRISGPSPDKPAVIDAEKAQAMQLVRSAYIEVENLHIVRAKGSGLMFDDGGKNDFGCHHVTIHHCRIEEVGPEGGTCGIKMAGVSDFAIRDCTFRGWGVAGDAVDGVGCKNGVVEGCTFLAGHGSVAVQFKGGSEEIVVRRCLFNDVPDAGVNIGGSTGLPYFRPKPQGFEARKMVVEGNTFIGGRAAMVFGSSDGCVARFNTIYLPKTWAIRILQLNNASDFIQTRNGRFEDNLVVFKSSWAEGGINIGTGTQPETFTFARNAWYCVDAPARSAPKLPVKEKDALIGADPKFANPEKGDFTVAKDSPARTKGSQALPVAKR